MQPKKVLLLEFNEITWTIIDPMMAKGKLPNLARMKREGAWGSPEALERYPHLDPWITWVTLHTGVERSVHGATVLEQDQDTIKAKRTWDYVVDAGKSIGVFGSVSAFPPRPVKGFMVPGPFSPSDDTYPAYFKPVQALNRMHTRAHNKVEGEAGPLGVIKQGIDLLRFGLRPETCLRIAKQLIHERLDKHVKWRRPALQPLVNYDFFAHMYRRFRPDYATFHTNHAAHYMHHYWRAYDDSQFLAKSPPDEKKHLGGAVEYGYELCDELLGRFMKLADSDTVVVLATSMGQKPYVKDNFPTGRFVARFKDVRKILELCGAKTVTEIVHVMNPQVNVKIPDAAERRQVMEHCSRVRRQIGGGPRTETIYVVEVGDILTITPGGLADGDTAQVRYFFDGAPGARTEGYAFDELFALDAPSAKQGMHDPRGLVILHGPGIRPGVELTGAGPLDIAPTILSLLGIAIPASMPGRPLVEAWQEPEAAAAPPAALRVSA
jgi:predicted AlkP superfamily phosphohydrolase/phosphomutase